MCPAAVAGVKPAYEAGCLTAPAVPGRTVAHRCTHTLVSGMTDNLNTRVADRLLNMSAGVQRTGIVYHVYMTDLSRDLRDHREHVVALAVAWHDNSNLRDCCRVGSF